MDYCFGSYRVVNTGYGCIAGGVRRLGLLVQRLLLQDGVEIET